MKKLSILLVVVIATALLFIFKQPTIAEGGVGFSSQLGASGAQTFSVECKVAPGPSSGRASLRAEAHMSSEPLSLAGHSMLQIPSRLGLFATGFFLSSCLGAMPRNAGPLASVDEIAIGRLSVGGTLAPRGFNALELYLGDMAGREKLKVDLFKAVAGKLEEAGIEVHDDSENTISFEVNGGFFGSPVASDDAFVSLNIYVDVGDESECPGLVRSVLFVVKESEIAATVIRVIKESLDEFISQRRRARGH